MSGVQGRRHRAGFALILTIALLALLVLAVYALSVLVRVDSQIVTASSYQARARQHALLGLQIALGELQRTAGPDDRVTAMAGMAGVPPQSTLRHWCGVWRPGSSWPEAWLTSGAEPGGSPSLSGERMVLVGVNTVGSPADRTDQELVEAGLVEISAPGGTRSGRYAYWVGDEGAKVSAVILAEELHSAATSGTGLRPNLRRLVGGNFSPGAASLAKVMGFDQLRLTASGVSLTGSFHSLTHRSRALPSSAPFGSAGTGDYVVGAFNINTTSEAAWRAWLEFPDQSNSVFGLNATRTLSGGRRLRDLFALRGAPFMSVVELRESGLVQAAFDSASPKITTVTQAEFLDELTPMLAVRSDTFRIRAYGEAANPADGGREAVAYCEAIVQRTPEMIDVTFGRRFTVVYFRWLGPDDI